jgi:hypothetical protein
LKVCDAPRRMGLPHGVSRSASGGISLYVALRGILAMQQTAVASDS